jgi:hypothetical protein
MHYSKDKALIVKNAGSHGITHRSDLTTGTRNRRAKVEDIGDKALHGEWEEISVRVFETKERMRMEFEGVSCNIPDETGQAGPFREKDGVETGGSSGSDIGRCVSPWCGGENLDRLSLSGD